MPSTPTSIFGAPISMGLIAISTLLTLFITGCVSFPISATDFPNSPHTPPQPIHWDTTTRTLIVFAPGTREGKIKYFAALDRLEIPYQVGLQINAYLPLKEHVPEIISPDRINAYEAFVKASREWNPKRPVIAYYDYEPDHGSWNWTVQKRGYRPADQRFFRRAVAELRSYQGNTGNTLPLGFYGQPVTRKDKAWNAQDRRNIINNKPLLDGFDWIVLSIYARGAIVNQETEAEHRKKIRHNWQVMQEVFPDRPILPMVYLNEIKPDDEYGRVYFDELNKLNISTMAIWANPDSVQETQFSIRQLEENAEYIHAWLRSDPIE